MVLPACAIETPLTVLFANTLVWGRHVKVSFPIYLQQKGVHCLDVLMPKKRT